MGMGVLEQFNALAAKIQRHFYTARRPVHNAFDVFEGIFLSLDCPPGAIVVFDTDGSAKRARLVCIRVYVLVRPSQSRYCVGIT